MYTQFVALDANFRMKRKKVSSELLDPSLTQGYGYFVEEGGYQAHLKLHTTEKQQVCLDLASRHAELSNRCFSPVPAFRMMQLIALIQRKLAASL